ncbi:MAG: tyrosine-type recombinase/integrase [Woeseiaceae bacterium]
MRRWDTLLDAYIEEYETRGIHPQTIDNAHRELMRMGNWMKRRRPKPRLEDIGPELLTRYIQHRTPFKSKATIYSVMSHMRCFGNYLVRQGAWLDNPLKWMHGPKVTPYNRMPKRIDAKDMKILWQAAAAAGQSTYRKHLGITVLSLLYGTGLRRGELQRLDVGDWNREDGTLRIDGRKTGKERCVAVPSIGYHCIETFLPHRHNHLEKHGRLHQQALLVSNSGGRMAEQAVSNLVHKTARRAGLKLHSLHQFRHTCASDMIAAGIPVPEVQRTLGHASVSTTMRYLHIADPERREAIAMHPLNDWLATEATT